MAESSVPASVTAVVDALGGPRIFSMAFAWMSYDATPAALTVSLEIAKPLVKSVPGKGHRVVVTLAPDDTYTVTLLKVGKLSRKTWEWSETVAVAALDGVHANRLRAAVEGLTGLRMTLGTMGAAS
jgi:hypothetical protein